MSASYPGTVEAFIALSGTSKLSSPDHTTQHTLERDNIVAIETVMGTNSGTAVLKNFVAGDFAARVNGETFGTPTIGTITVPGTTNPLGFSAGILSKVVTLTDVVGTITPNAQAGQIFSLICGTTAGTRTIAAPVNALDGASLIFRVKQNAGTTGVLVFDSASYKFAGGTANAFALGTIASSWNYYGFRYNALGTICDDQGNLKDII